MATNKGYSIRNFEEWKNGGQNGGSSQTTANSSTFGEPQHTTSNKYSVQSFEEWRQNRTSGVTPGGDSVIMDWMDRYNLVMQGVSAYDKKRNGGFTRDASGGFGSEIDSLIADYDGIEGYASEYGFRDAQKYLVQLKKLQNSIQGINDSFSQFEDEDAYNRYMDYWKDQEEKRNLDLEAGQKDIDDLEDELRKLKRVSPGESAYLTGNVSQGGSVYAANLQGDVSDKDERIAELSKLISQKQAYLNQAKRIQKKDEYSAVADLESEKYDTDFDSKSGYVSTEQDGKLERLLSQYSMGYDDLTYEYINNQNGIRDEIKQKAGAYKKGETAFEAKGYDYMTEDEVGLYNYYYSMGGKASAEAYLDTIQEDLDDRKAAGIAEDIKGRTAAEMLFGVEAGLDQFKSGIKGVARAAIGDDSYVAPSAIQKASGLVREDLADDGAKLPSWLGGASLGQVGYDAITTTANMAPSIAVGMLNPTLGTAALGISAGGNAYQEALNEGYSVDQARGYGILSGASEIVMEKVLGGISAYGGNALGKFFTQNMKNADTALKRIAKELGGSMLSEFSEEYLQEVLTPVFKNLTLGTDEEVKLVSAEALYAGLLGAITGGIMEGPKAIANARNATEVPGNATVKESLTTELANSEENATADNAAAVTEESSAVDDKLSATESTVGKIPGKDESSTAKVGVSKMETVQQTADIESFAEQFGTQAEAVRRNYMEGQDLQEYEVGFEAAYTMGRDGGKAESLNNSTLPGLKYLSQSQRDIAFSLGRDAAAAQKAAETKAATAKAPTTKASLGQTAQLVAEDGSNSGTVTIAEIVSMDNSGMTLRLEDGRTVTDEDLDFPEGAEVYSTVMELGMDAESANAIVKASAAASIPRTAVAEGIETAYHYGRYGYGMDALLKARETAGMPESILQESYRAGEKRRQQSRETAQANGNRTDRKADERERKGKVHFRGETDTLNDVQRESLRGLEWIADLTGAQIHVENMGNSEGLSRTNGLYDPADDSIHIDLRAGSDGTGTLLYTAAHEFVHRMRQNNETAFYRLADFLVEQYGKKGISTDALVKQQMADAAKDGIELDYDEAFEEMVADAMEAMFTDTDALAKMEKLKTQDRRLWQEIKDFVLGLAEKIKAAYARLKPDSAEARYVLQMKESIDQFAQLFAEGVMENRAEKNTAESSGVKHQARRGVKITMHMTDSERTEILKNKVITAEVYKGQADESIQSEKENLTSNRDGLVKAALVKIGEEFGVFTDYSISDVDVDIRLSRGNLKESISKKIDPITIAKLMPTLKTAVENAVGIECHANRYFYDNNTVMFENLLGGYVDGERFVPIRFGLKHSVAGKATLYLIVDQEGIDIKKIKAEVSKATVMHKHQADNTSRSAFNISITSMVPFVKEKDLLRYLPDGMLNANQKTAKYDAISETFAYTNDKNDRKYAEFIKTGNMVAANLMVQQAARTAGYTGLFYHGSKKGGGFTKFRDWAYFTQNKGYAERYTQRENPDSLYTVYVKMEKPFDTRNADAEKLFAEIHDEYGLGEIQDSGLPDWTDGYDIADYIDENELGYDSIVLDEGGDLVDGKPVSRGLSYVVRKSEQIKSADVITYDDNGNVIPISQRFNSENPDIRYSRRKQSETEALQEQNAKLQEDVTRLKELVKLQGQVTNGKILKPSSVEAAAKYLKKLFHTYGDTKELAQKLNGLYEYIASDPELTWEGVKEQAAPIVQWLQDNEKFQRDQYAQDVLDTLKGQSFRLDETQLGEVKSQYGSLKEYRMAVKNMASSKSTQSLDQLWQELSGQYPDVFSPDTSASDMPLAFAEAVERLEGMESTETAMDWRMKDQAMLEAVYDSYWRVSGLETVADKYSKKLFEIRGKHYEKMAELRKDRNQKLKELRESKKQSVKAVRENRNKAAEKKKIHKTISQLNKLLFRGNKKQNVKKGMEDFAAAALASAEILFADNISNEDMILNGIGTQVDAKENRLIEEVRALLQKRKDLYNLDAASQEMEDIVFTGESESYAQRMAESKKLDRKISEKMRQLKGVFERERNRLNEATVSGILEDLAKAYKSLGSSDALYIRAATDERVYQYLTQLKDTIGGTTVQDMSAAQLKALSDAYTMVLTTIRNANKAFTDGRSIQAEAEQMAAEFRSRKIPEKALGIAAKKVMDSIGWNYEKLHYALDRIGSPTLSRLFNNLADSENITMRDVQEAKAYQKEMVEKYHYNDWKIDQKIDHPFVDNTGKKFHLTLGELMALYAYSRRDGADRHIEYGGFKLGKSALTDPKPATTYKLTAEQLAKITEMLTEEQRTFAEGMQKYLSETMGAKGNEVSMKLYGIEMFKEENYFPLHIAGEFKAQAQESQAKAAAGFQTMSNAGFTQTRNKESTAPIVLEDFMSVWADHVNEMARYHGAVPALEDIRRVMNYSVYSDADSESMSVEAAMTNAFGKQAVQYFDNLYREANSGAITDKLDAAPKKMLSLFRKNAVAYSVSVWIQQPASIYRARMMVDRKYFGRHGFFTLTGGVLRILNRKKWNTTYEEMMRYAPGVTMAKEIGGFDTSTGSSIRSYLMDTEKSFSQSMKNDTAKDKAKSVLKLVDDNAIANLPNVMDKVAWIEMWEACKRETVARNPQMETDSKAFLEKVGHRFTEVIRGTQVYDSMFAKSPMLKTNNLFIQSAVSFMNEPNTVANMAEATIRDLARGNKKQAAKTAAALVTSIVANELLKSIVYAMRDDDEDETLLEKYISAVAGSLIDDVTVFNYVPYARDVWSVWQGYDAERADMAIVSDAVSAVKKLSQLSGEDAAAMTEEELLKWSEEVTDARWAVAETLSPLFGIPLKNIRRDMLAVFNAVKIRGLDKERQSTALSIRHTVEDAIWQGSKSGADRLYEAMVAGDDAYVQRLRNNYKSDDAYHTAIKKALRDNDSRIWEAAVAWNAGELETYIRIAKEIRGEGRFDQDDIVLAIRAEANSMLEKDDSSSDKVYGYFTAEKFGVAMSQGNTTMVDMIRQDLIDTDIANGKTREEAEKSVQRKARTQLKELYTGGTISASTAEKMLVKYAGKSYEEADELVSEWQFDMDYPDSDISFSDYQKWEDNGKGLGISLEIYTEYKTRTKGIENDKDVNGNSIPYTAVQKIMTVINSLPLSESQKYALARSQGWSEKTIQKYKQW